MGRAAWLAACFKVRLRSLLATTSAVYWRRLLSALGLAWGRVMPKVPDEVLIFCKRGRKLDAKGGQDFLALGCSAESNSAEMVRQDAWWR